MTYGKIVKPLPCRAWQDFRLAAITIPEHTAGVREGGEAEKLLTEGVANSRICRQLYADDHWARLLIFQAMEPGRERRRHQACQFGG